MSMFTTKQILECTGNECHQVILENNEGVLVVTLIRTDMKEPVEVIELETTFAAELEDAAEKIIAHLYESYGKTSAVKRLLAKFMQTV